MASPGLKGRILHLIKQSVAFFVQDEGHTLSGEPSDALKNYLTRTAARRALEPLRGYTSAEDAPNVWVALWRAAAHLCVYRDHSVTHLKPILDRGHRPNQERLVP